MDLVAVVIRCIAGPPGLAGEEAMQPGPLTDFVIPLAECLRAMCVACCDAEARAMLQGATPVLTALAVALDADALEAAAAAPGEACYVVSKKRVGVVRSVESAHPYTTSARADDVVSGA